MPRNRRQSFHLAQQTQNIPAKANRILNIILIAFVLIIIRVWHLSVIQHEKREEESRRPQRRQVIEPARRGTIRDRFNIPLAINRIQYQASLQYSPIRQIPSIRWETDSERKRVKRFKRKEYIAKLAQLLGNELSLDPDRVEDLIHAKGALYNQIPFIIKEDISEKEYYRLKMFEKDWPGIQAVRMPRRYYPLGRIGGDIIGYMGSINRNEYERLIQEMASLREYNRARESDENPELPPGFNDPAQVRRRLRELEEKTYTMNDSIGKAGIESRFERDLRGFSGKKNYYSDARGNFLRELPGSREPLSGQRLLLTISAELQEFSEKLLIQNEQIREIRATAIDKARQTFLQLKHPWIKGGAIVVMDPHTGEVLAMASHPRYDPNDFILGGTPEVNKKKISNILRWFENEKHIAEIWDQKREFERERYNDSKRAFYDEGIPLTWSNYLHLILPKNSTISSELENNVNIVQAVEIEKKIKTLLEISSQNNLYAVLNEVYNTEPHHVFPQKLSANQKVALSENLEKNPEVKACKRYLDKWFINIHSNEDKVLFVDLCRVAIDGARFDKTLLGNVGQQSLEEYRDASASMSVIGGTVKEMAKELYHTTHFTSWRKENEKQFLKEKREEEKILKRYAKPYIDHLDTKESEMFKEFWQLNKWNLCDIFLCGKGFLNEDLQTYSDHFSHWHKEIANGAHRKEKWCKAYLKLQNIFQKISSQHHIAYMKTLRSFSDLDRPLLGKYKTLRKKNQLQTENHLASAFYPVHGYGYGRSQAYRQAATQGSIFKLVTAYTALIEKHDSLKNNAVNKSNLNPLEIVDTVFTQGKDSFVGYTSDGKPIPRNYKGGRLPRSSIKNLGKINLLKALETSSNPYFSLLASDVLSSPKALEIAAKNFSYGNRTGISLPAEIAGKVPDDLETNRTGLYATAIGQHSMVVTPLQTCVMLSALANGGNVLIPKIIALSAGRKPQHGEDPLICLPNFPYQDTLEYVGIDFPLFLSLETKNKESQVKKTPILVQRQIYMPEIVRKILLEGMQRMVTRSHAESLSGLSRLYHNHPEAMSDYVDLKDELFGKTSTAESIEHIDMENEPYMYNHVWFGGISFDHSDKEVVVVKDKYGVPEVVVVVYLRFGGFGKEAGPVAAQVVSKWREIKARNLSSNRFLEPPRG